MGYEGRFSGGPDQVVANSVPDTQPTLPRAHSPGVSKREFGAKPDWLIYNRRRAVLEEQCCWQRPLLTTALLPSKHIHPPILRLRARGSRPTIQTAAPP